MNSSVGAIVQLPVFAAVVGALIALCGVGVNAYINTRLARKAREHELSRDRLDRLYSPLVAVRARIRALSELRDKIDSHANKTWQEGVREAREHSVARVEAFASEHGASYHAIVERANEQLRTDLIPQYEHMVDLLVKNYWLAEPSTRDQLPALIEFVELWKGWLGNSLPPSVIESIGLSEKALAPLYDDLDTVMRSLQERLRA